jgi:hypothetical protein
MLVKLNTLYTYNVFLHSDPIKSRPPKKKKKSNKLKKIVEAVEDEDVSEESVEKGEKNNYCSLICLNV